MDIRIARNRDIPGMLELLRQVGGVHHDIRPDIFRTGARKYDHADLENLLTDKTRPIFVAVEGESVLGYCFCIHRQYENDPVLTDRKEVYIDDLCVDESARGQGIARTLCDHVLRYASECGCAFVTLNVWCGNDGAMKFYEKMGMTPRSITMEMKLC